VYVDCCVVLFEDVCACMLTDVRDRGFLHILAFGTGGDLQI